MIYRVINEKYSILSIGPELVPEKYRGHILVFYIPKLDAVVLSEDCQVFESPAEMTAAYLELDDRQRKTFLDTLDDSRVGKELREIMDVLNRVIRIRRKLRRHK